MTDRDAREQSETAHGGDPAADAGSESQEEGAAAMHDAEEAEK
jgi:hypothetical protein